MNRIKIKINGQEIFCPPGQTIMEAARSIGIEIPGLCHHEDFPAKASCRICVVEVRGKKHLVTSCSKKIEEGMDIRTDSDRVKRVRNLNIELIFAEHIEKCPTCIWRVNCQLLNLAEKYKIEVTRFRDRKAGRKTYRFANAVEIDGSQCIDCRNCLDACNSMQKINYLKLAGKGINQEVIPVNDNSRILSRFRNIKTDCIYCGQCAVHCPVGSAQEQSQWEMVEKALKDNGKNPKSDKIMVAQFAPSVRVSLGEEFGMPSGKTVTNQIISALHKLGFNYVFDVNFGADITTLVEARELYRRITKVDNKPLPMFTSCCPAWIKYVEFFRPDLIPNLTTARSPHLHSAGLIKTYWANLIRVNPKNIILVSVMPCTAKKFESTRPELKIKGNWPIDYVITTRELAWLIKKNNIDLLKLRSKLASSPLSYSSAGVIYGASGGVMESALRTAQYLLKTAQDISCQAVKPNLCRSRLEFKNVRGLEGVKEATVQLGERKVRVAVVNGIGNIKPVLDKIKNYDYIEVMACPGGCIGGGGQPIPTTPEIRAKRLEALYKIDIKSKIRRAHENKDAIKALDWLKKRGKLAEQVLHTKYKIRSRKQKLGIRYLGN